MSSLSVWQIHLLGGLRLQRGPESITRFRSQKFGALLAYLALFPHRLHSREELADLLWPEADGEAGRVNLRTALSSLRRQLEPPGEGAGSVFVTDGRSHLHLNADAIRTDVADFEAALAAASRTGKDDETATRHLSRAVGLYAGPLLPGYYEPWALSERDRLAEAYLRALGQLSLLKERAGDADAALDYARRAVSADPLREESHGSVIRLLMASGQAAAAKRQFEELARLLKDSYDAQPDPQIKALLANSKAPPAPAPERAAAPPAPAAVSMPPVPAAPSRESADAVPQNLPLILTRFFGRDEEIEALRARLESADTRLVTITGPGGSGKTRVAVETAGTLQDRFRAGIWFVPLVDVREADRLPEALAAALGLTGGGANGAPRLALVAEALQNTTGQSGSRVLLVLDNFEQLAEAASGMIAELLARVPDLCCLVTSRQRLRIESETEFPLLPLPTPEYPGTPGRLLEFSSVQLFVSRAQLARADFQLTGRNAASVASLCSRLEGMPLAIELAAAWMGVLSPSQMLARMSKCLDLLVSRRRDVSPRHRTLRAAIESSVALLSPPVRQFFATLSVFRGGWTLEAAEAVTGEPLALEYLTELTDHSLIVRVSHSEADDSEAVLRFRMLETLREFSTELLQETGGDTSSAMESQHIAFFTQFVEEGAPQLTGPQQAEWLRRLQADHTNIRAMLDYLDQRGETTEALRIGGLLTGFWPARGHITEGRQLLAHLLERAGDEAPALLRAQALSGMGKLAYMQGDYDVARKSHDTCLAIYRAEGDASGVARTLCELGNCEMLKSNYAGATAFCKESLAGYRALGDKKGIALLLNNLGALCLAKGLPDAALPYLEESLPLSREIGHHRIVALVLLNLASIWQNEGDSARAHSYYEQCLVVRRELGDEVGIGRVLEGLARVAMEAGDAETAQCRFEESLQVRRKHQDRDGLASALLYRGLTAVKLQQDLARGGSSLRECLEVCQQTGNRHFASYALEGLASIAVAQQQLVLAVRLWSAAHTLRETLGVTPRPKDAQALAQEIEAARAALEAAAFEAAWQEGKLLTLDDAISLGTAHLPQIPVRSGSETPDLAAAAV